MLNRAKQEQLEKLNEAMRRQQAQHGFVLDQSQYPPGFEFRPEWEREAALHLAWFATHQEDIDIGDLRVDGIKFGSNNMKTLTIDALISALIVSPSRCSQVFAVDGD